MTIPHLDVPLSVPLPDVAKPPSSVIIERVQPEIDAGRYPVKRVAGDILEVSADIFKDGHDTIAAERGRAFVLWSQAIERSWATVRA